MQDGVIFLKERIYLDKNLELKYSFGRRGAWINSWESSQDITMFRNDFHLEENKKRCDEGYKWVLALSTKQSVEWETSGTTLAISNTPWDLDEGVYGLYKKIAKCEG